MVSCGRTHYGVFDTILRAEFFELGRAATGDQMAVDLQCRYLCIGAAAAAAVPEYICAAAGGCGHAFLSMAAGDVHVPARERVSHPVQHADAVVVWRGPGTDAGDAEVFEFLFHLRRGRGRVR